MSNLKDVEDEFLARNPQYCCFDCYLLEYLNNVRVVQAATRNAFPASDEEDCGCGGKATTNVFRGLSVSENKLGT